MSTGVPADTASVNARTVPKRSRPRVRPSVNGGGKVDHMGGSIVGLRLSTFRGNVRLSVQQKCHLSNPGSYQMSTAPVVRFAAALDTA